MGSKSIKQTLADSRNAKNAADAQLPDAERARLEAERVQNEAASRLALTDHANSGKATDSVKTDESTESTVKTALESALARIGFKSAKQVSGKADEITVKSDSLGKMMSLTGAFVALVGVDTGDVSRLIVRINPTIVQSLADAKVKAPKTPGESAYIVTMVYKPRAASESVNAIDHAEYTDGQGTITLASGKAITVETDSITELTGKLPANGKDRQAMYADVLYADGKNERIVSYWLPGLMNAITARKSAITGDHKPANPAAINAPINLSVDETDESTESTDSQ